MYRGKKELLNVILSLHQRLNHKKITKCGVVLISLSLSCVCVFFVVVVSKVIIAVLMRGHIIVYHGHLKNDEFGST